jgi:hypothetical protein
MRGSHRLTTNNIFDVHAAAHRDKFLVIKATICTNFSKVFIFEWNSTCFGQFLCPSSGVFHCTHRNGICHTGLLTSCSILILLASCQQTCMTYTIPVCTVENSWWWTEKLSETCRFSLKNESFWEINAYSWFCYKKWTIYLVAGNVRVDWRLPNDWRRSC